MSNAPPGLLGRDQSKCPKVHLWQMSLCSEMKYFPPPCSPLFSWGETSPSAQKSISDRCLSAPRWNIFLLRVHRYSPGARPVQVAKSSSLTDVSNVSQLQDEVFSNFIYSCFTFPPPCSTIFSWGETCPKVHLWQMSPISLLDEHFTIQHFVFRPLCWDKSKLPKLYPWQISSVVSMTKVIWLKQGEQ